jgi:predicted NAD/FAD-binding protein
MTTRSKIAVVGAGIAGIAAAWRLQQSGAEVHLFERGERLGGHTHTHALEVTGGTVPLDTGFIVFNNHNYPNFSAWLDELGVPSQDSDMSFAVRDDIARLEYGTTDLRAMLSNYAQLAKPAFWGMWRDLLRFYRRLADGEIPDITLGEYLRQGHFSPAFVNSHIAPMCAALWSQPAEESLQLSLRHVVEFMRNHKMLNVTDRPRWRVVRGGSSSYLNAFTQRFEGRVHLQCDVGSIRRTPGGVVFSQGDERHFDAVVLACHSDQALALLEDPAPAELDVLGAIPYQDNDVLLHEDASFMPRNRNCWSSWNVIREPDGAYTITYWMNKLQGLDCAEQFFVTLNPQREPQSIRWQGRYQHPHFTQASFNAQQRWAELSVGNTQFAGAYWGKGFHEDGYVSGQRAAETLVCREVQHAA